MIRNHKARLFAKIRRHFIAGILTIIPIAITFVIVKFLLDLIIKIGEPAVQGVVSLIRPYSPQLANWLLHPWFATIVAIVVVIVSINLLGFIATRVIGKQILSWFDAIIDQIPFVKNIYGSSKKLVTALEQKPDGVQRVVLIDFPHKEMKVVGLVTRTFSDEHTGQKLAAVYIPTTPNPTSGYLEIVPMDKVISTSWSVDEAMTFIVSGGAVAPEHITIENLDIIQDIENNKSDQ